MKKPYVTMQVGETEYKLKFSAAASVEAEKKLGKGLMASLQTVDSVTTQITMLWASLQKYNHGIKMEDAENIYDAYMDSETGGFEEFLEILVEVFVVSGFIKPDQAEEIKETKPEEKSKA